MSRKHKSLCTTLNCIEHFLILASTATGCISISAFSSLICIHIGITNSVIGLKISAVTAAIKNIRQWLRKRKRSIIRQYS